MRNGARRGLLAALYVVAASLFSAAMPLAASAFLPDNRIYEQTSPANKDGNVVFPTPPYWRRNLVPMGLASEEGNAVMFGASGAVGSTNVGGGVQQYVAHRVPGVGWVTAPADTRTLAQSGLIGSVQDPGFYPSRDFSRVVFDPSGCCANSAAPYVSEEPANGSDLKLYLSENPLVEPRWLGKPMIAKPIPALGGETPEWLVAGVSPDALTGYFTYTGTLLAEDETSTRAAILALGGGDYGFYEWAPGPAGEQLKEAAVLPDGKISAFGATAAALVEGAFAEHAKKPEMEDNQVSQDATRAFFVSPLPEFSKVSLKESCEERLKAQEAREKEAFANNKTPEPHLQVCSGEAPQLYVREALPGGEHRTTLISRSNISGAAGNPAPTGVRPFRNAQGETTSGSTYAYASPDGSHVYFASEDKLTGNAPSGAESKMYEFDLTTGELIYLPELKGEIAASSKDGSRLLFGDSGEVKLFTSTPAGGAVETIASKVNGLTPAQASTDGSAFLFYASPGEGSSLSKFNNGGYDQFYHYNVARKELACVSCPPRGVSPTASAETNLNGEIRTVKPVRNMSADGTRVFFQSQDALVGADVNGMRDVYEWENGHVYLISPGNSLVQAYFFDSSETGADVFFATEQSLVPSDGDFQTDIYDARIPRPGDNPPPAKTPCEGEVCQGPPSVPQLLTPAASATFEGLGNIPPEAEPVVKAAKKQQKRCRKGLVRKKGRCVAKKHKASGRSTGRKSHTSNRRGK